MLTIDLKLILETPLHIGDGSEQRHFMRDARGRMYIRAGTVKGLHRAAARYIATGVGLTICQASCYPMDGQTACIVCQLFGSPWAEGRLYYRDLAVATPTSDITIETATITRTTQSRRRRTQKSISREALEMLPVGTTISGQINHLLHDQAQLGLALAALRSIQAVGAANAVGYGLCRVEAYALDKNKNRINDHDPASALALLRPRKP